MRFSLETLNSKKNKDLTYCTCSTIFPGFVVCLFVCVFDVFVLLWFDFGFYYCFFVFVFVSFFSHHYSKKEFIPPLLCLLPGILKKTYDKLLTSERNIEPQIYVISPPSLSKWSAKWVMPNSRKMSLMFISLLPAIPVAWPCSTKTGRRNFHEILLMLSIWTRLK